MEVLKEKAIFWEALLIRGFGLFIFGALISSATNRPKLAGFLLFLSLVSLMIYCVIGILEMCFLEEERTPLSRLIRVFFQLFILIVTGYIFNDLFGKEYIEFLFNVNIQQNYESIKKYLML